MEVNDKSKMSHKFIVLKCKQCDAEVLNRRKRKQGVLCDNCKNKKWHTCDKIKKDILKNSFVRY